MACFVPSVCGSTEQFISCSPATRGHSSQTCTPAFCPLVPKCLFYNNICRENKQKSNGANSSRTQITGVFLRRHHSQIIEWESVYPFQSSFPLNSFFLWLKRAFSFPRCLGLYLPLFENYKEYKAFLLVVFLTKITTIQQKLPMLLLE